MVVFRKLWHSDGKDVGDRDERKKGLRGQLCFGLAFMSELELEVLHREEKQLAEERDRQCDFDIKLRIVPLRESFGRCVAVSLVPIRVNGLQQLRVLLDVHGDPAAPVRLLELPNSDVENYCNILERLQEVVDL